MGDSWSWPREQLEWTHRHQLGVLPQHRAHSRCMWICCTVTRPLSAVASQIIHTLTMSETDFFWNWLFLRSRKDWCWFVLIFPHRTSDILTYTSSWPVWVINWLVNPGMFKMCWVAGSWIYRVRNRTGRQCVVRGLAAWLTAEQSEWHTVLPPVSGAMWN